MKDENQYDDDLCLIDVCFLPSAIKSYHVHYQEMILTTTLNHILNITLESLTGRSL